MPQGDIKWQDVRQSSDGERDWEYFRCVGPDESGCGCLSLQPISDRSSLVGIAESQVERWVLEHAYMIQLEKGVHA